MLTPATEHVTNYGSSPEISVPPTSPPREDLTVHVKLTRIGVWHRKAIGGAHTACGRPLNGYAVRDETYEGELCQEGCFSDFELTLNTPTEKRP